MNDADTAAPYRVLARKYRPQDFDGLIGQGAMVRTLSNAIAQGRLAHAFVLTGVRGVGKTTTARIIARGLNCVGPDGGGGPTVKPCGACEPCRAIAEDRHVDVLEMDAASHTGVDGIRDLIDGVRYRPASARFKVYIIDEVHMLSKGAFNALLKTLEEPPEHVKFIFATTEIRKIPVTVLSRCQRFDLRRVDGQTLAAHFAAIAKLEGADIDGPALALIARAADGSVRDGLSLLDQAISHAGGAVDETQVRAMLGLADRTQTFEILDAVMGGDAGRALNELTAQYTAGADPAQVLGDMLELTHWLTRIKVVPEAADDAAAPEAERVRGRDMAGRLSMAAIARAWQMLLKGLGEVRNAPSPLQAAEMVLVRLAYAAELPTPGEALQDLAPGGGTAPPPSAQPAPQRQPAPRPEPEPEKPSGPETTAQPAPETPPSERPAAPENFRALVDHVRAAGKRVLGSALAHHARPVSFAPGTIEINPTADAPPDLAPQLAKHLNDSFGGGWIVTVRDAEAGATIAEEDAARKASAISAAQQHPLVQAVKETFPGATVEAVHRPDGDP